MYEHKFNSSNIDEAAYDPQTGTLIVIFVSGWKYRYHGVPEDVWHDWLRAGSGGRFHHNFIKWSYEFERIG